MIDVMDSDNQCVRHASVEYIENKFSYLEEEPFRGNVNYRDKYLCGLIYTCMPIDDGYVVRVKWPGKRGYWMVEEYYFVHSDGSSDPSWPSDAINCPMCLDHPRYGLWLLAQTDLD